MTMISTGALLASLLASGSLPAQQASAVQVEPQDDEVVLPDVIVSSGRPRGSVESDIQPELVLDPAQIQAYGASNIGELLAALAPQTRSTRGRGDGQPVLLVNGRRISGFREIQGIPTEAIERTEVLPEEVALVYGYPADQRVVNFVLKAQFRSLTGQVSLRAPFEGGRSTQEAEGNLFRIQDGDRWTFDIEATRESALFETDRDIQRTADGAPFDRIGNVTGLLPGAQIDPALSALVGSPVTVAGAPTGSAIPGLADFTTPARTGDLTAYRTLLPRLEREELNGAVTRDLNSTTKGTIQASLERRSTFAYLGLPGAALTLPEGSAYSPFADDVRLYRYVDRPEALAREVDALNGSASVVLDGLVGDWRWTATGAYSRNQTDTETGRGIDASNFQTRLNAGDPTANPFGDWRAEDFASLPRDTARSVNSNASAEVVFTGRAFDFPAGRLQSTLKFGADHTSLESESVRSGVFTERSLSRDRANATGSFTLPVASRNQEVLSAIGDLSINFNLGYEEVSDFGGLPTFGLGFNWSPIEPLGVTVSYTDEQAAPSVQQLNDPVVSTPNTPVFDFRTGQTVNVIRIDGGNPALRADNRRVLRVGLNLRPWSERDFNLSTSFTRSVTDDAITAFPALTSDLEAALPERFVRDADGRLVSFDARPLNFTRQERADLRTGFNFSRAFGTPNPTAAAEGPGGPRFGGPGGGQRGPRMGEGAGSDGAGAGPRGGGGGPRFGGGGGRSGRGGGMQPGQGRFNVSIYHTWRIQDEVLIREGLPVLDLLDGSATGSRGGQPRHEIQAQAGVFRNGFGAFLNANWRDGTWVNGGPSGRSDLFFSDQTVVNINAFADLSQRPGLIERHPWLSGSRITVGVGNLFDSKVEVRSSSGELPLNYQPDFLDPLGRTYFVSFRKILF